MNLHGIVAGAIGVINPFVPAQIRVSQSSTTNPDGSRTPNYTIENATAQVQSLTFRDLTQISGLNLNGDKRAIYLYGDFNGVVRSQAKGGDLVIMTSGNNAGTWLIAQVLEQWPDWCKVAVVLQNGS